VKPFLNDTLFHIIGHSPKNNEKKKLPIETPKEELPMIIESFKPQFQTRKEL